MILSAMFRILSVASLCLAAGSAPAAQFTSESGPLNVVTVAEGLEQPWGLKAGV